jgi:hypothetical protein
MPSNEEILGTMSRRCEPCGEILRGAGDGGVGGGGVFALCSIGRDRWCSASEEARLKADYIALWGLAYGITGYGPRFIEDYGKIIVILRVARARLQALIFGAGQDVGAKLRGILTLGRKFGPRRGVDANAIFKINIPSPLVYRAVGTRICTYAPTGTMCAADTIEGVLCASHLAELRGLAARFRYVMPTELAAIVMDYVLEDYAAVVGSGSVSPEM